MFFKEIFHSWVTIKIFKIGIVVENLFGIETKDHKRRFKR